MGDLIILPVIRIERDGGKTRLRRRRAARNLSEPFTVNDLVMDHADPADTAPCDAGRQVIVRDDHRGRRLGV